MWLKLIGAVCIVTACGGGGVLAAQKLQQRVVLLRQLEQGLSLLAGEIDYGATPLAQALQQTGAALEGQAATLFLQTAAELGQSQGTTAEQAWRHGLASGVWQPEDEDILRRLGQGLGLSGRNDQLKRLDSARRQLAENCRQAQEQAAGYGKIWRSLGWGGGLILALFLF